MRDDYPLSPTFTGKRFDAQNLKVEDVCIEDIAHHLSQIARFTGACPFHYSVAQHSVLVAQRVPPSKKIPALLHDSPEAFLNDLTHNLKYYSPVGMPYLELEHRALLVICEALGVNVSDVESDVVKAADDLIFDFEWKQLIEGRPTSFHIERWLPEQAETHFLTAFHTAHEQKWLSAW